MKNIKINFTKGNGFVPAIIQENITNKILMMGFMNKEAVEKTFNKGFVYFWSRTREKIWLKGETSGNKLKVLDIFVDCDNDALLIKVQLLGKSVCHSGSYSCFYTKFKGEYV